jgi:DNA-binding protein WhiA
MASYSRNVKEELARVFDDDEELLRAELIAMLKVRAVPNNGRLDFTTSNAATARKVITLLKKVYPDVKKEVAITVTTPIKNKRCLMQRRYTVRIFFARYADELNSPKIVEDDFAKVSYLRGAFLAGGTVNKPEKKYYLEIASMSEDAALFVKEIWEYLEFNPTFRKRKEFFVNYICEGDAVEEFIGMIGAEESVEHFGVVRNLKEVRANVNRMVNADTFNLNRAIEAAKRQLEDIRIIQENNVKLNASLRLAIKARLTFPECSVSELAEKLYITKQGLNYRFTKIHEIALKTERQNKLKEELGIKSQ